MFFFALKAKSKYLRKTVYVSYHRVLVCALKNFVCVHLSETHCTAASSISGPKETEEMSKFHTYVKPS